MEEISEAMENDFRSALQRFWRTLRPLSGITLLSLPGEIYAGVLEKRARSIVESLIQEEQRGFCPSCGTLDQLYTLTGVLEEA